MRRFGFIGLLVTVLIVGVAGTIGYNWGYSAGLANTAAANGAAVIYGPGYGWGGGFPLFGLLFGLFFLFLIFGLIRRAAWGWGGGRGHYAGYGHARGGWGRGPWGGSDSEHTGAAKDVPPFVDGMLKDWHRQAHDQPRSSTAGTDAPPPASGGPSPA
jgi:hypothetical protein